MIVAGIDEAGYGPLLGPLVTALAAFSAPAGARDDLWRALRPAVRRRPPERGAWRALPVVDSKELHRGGKGFADLETVALAFSALASADGRPPETVGAFLGRHLAGGPLPTARYPWYGSALLERPLPRRADPARIAREAGRLRRAAGRAAVGVVRIAVRPLLVEEFNRRAARWGTKARVLFDLNVELLEDLRRRAAAPWRVRCDRHGGRRRYVELLDGAFPLEGVTVLGEARERSRYRVGPAATGLELDYVVGGERQGMEVALASIFAKYVRELFVGALNDHFRGRMADLRPTAGYWSDGLRFLEDLDRARVLTEDERRLLVRSR
ncbi:MAG: hypothetical protein ACF8XB_02755 [Planctomycetota bacterium JB042]